MIKLQVCIIPPQVQNAQLHNMELQPGATFSGDISVQPANGRSFLPGSTLNDTSTPLQPRSVGYKIDPINNMSIINPYMSRMSVSGLNSSFGYVSRKFLHITSSSNTLYNLAAEIEERFLKIYPDEKPLEIIKLQDINECDLDPDYTVSMIFDTSNIVRVLVANELKSDGCKERGGKLIRNLSDVMQKVRAPTKIQQENVSSIWNNTSNYQNGSKPSSQTTVASPTKLTVKKKSLENKVANQIKPVKKIKKSKQIPEPEGDGTIVMGPRKSVKLRVSSPIIAQGSPKRITSGMLDLASQPNLSKNYDAEMCDDSVREGIDDGYESASTFPEKGRRRVSVPSKSDILKLKKAKEVQIYDDEASKEKGQNGLEIAKETSDDELKADTTVITRHRTSKSKAVTELEISPSVKTQKISNQRSPIKKVKDDKDENKKSKAETEKREDYSLKDLSQDKTLDGIDETQPTLNVTSTPTRASPRKRKLHLEEGENASKRVKGVISVSKPLDINNARNETNEDLGSLSSKKKEEYTKENLIKLVDNGIKSPRKSRKRRRSSPFRNSRSSSPRAAREDEVSPDIDPSNIIPSRRRRTESIERNTSNVEKLRQNTRVRHTKRRSQKVSPSLATSSVMDPAISLSRKDGISSKGSHVSITSLKVKDGSADTSLTVTKPVNTESLESAKISSDHSVNSQANTKSGLLPSNQVLNSSSLLKVNGKTVGDAAASSKMVDKSLSKLISSVEKEKVQTTEQQQKLTSAENERVKSPNSSEAKNDSKQPSYLAENLSKYAEDIIDDDSGESRASDSSSDSGSSSDSDSNSD